MQSVTPASGGPIEGVRQLVSFSYSIQDQCQSLDEGYSIEIASLDSPASPGLDFPDCPVYPLRRFWFDFIFPFSLLIWLLKNATSYDLVVINCVWDWHLLAVWLSRIRHRYRYILFTHGHLDPWFKRRYPLKHLKKWLFWPWAIYPCLRDAQAVVFTCEEERILARDSFWLYRCNEFVIPYGTKGIPDSDRDYASAFIDQYPSLRHLRCVLFLGRVHPKKGPDLLLRAIHTLQNEGLWESSLHRLVIAGPSTGAYAQSLRQLADKLFITESILWTGMLQGDQKWGAFQVAEIFVLPSHQENFGIAVAEALSASKPVLITHGVNIWPEIIADGSGFVEHDTVEGTINLLRHWLQLDIGTLQAMGLTAKKSFEQRYSVNEFANSYVSLSNLIVSL